MILSVIRTCCTRISLISSFIYLIDENRKTITRDIDKKIVLYHNYTLNEYRKEIMCEYGGSENNIANKKLLLHLSLM
jgi:hypothetical protein